jgi:hypothetical protein
MRGYRVAIALQYLLKGESINLSSEMFTRKALYLP